MLKFIGDGVLAFFPVTGVPAEACEAALRAVVAARAGMAHLDAMRQAQGLPSLPFGVALHLGEILWGNVGAVDRLDFTATAPQSAAAGATLRSFSPPVSAFPDRGVGPACTSSFSRLARRSLVLRPAHSRCNQFVTL